jgi:diadenosine tetraphosphate (Ap4A) HIT family hydrolase
MFDHPRNNDDLIFIATLEISTLFLFRDQRFRGYSILSFDLWDATRLDDLSEAEYTAFCQDLRLASRARRSAMQPDHMNYELLGNSNPHLHWHIIPRYRDDPRWGRPIWEGYPRNEFKLNRYTLTDEAYEYIIAQIHVSLAHDTEDPA